MDGRGVTLMRTLLIVVLVLMSQMVQAEHASDIAQIERTILNYFDGVRLADRSRLEKAFAVDAAHMKAYLADDSGNKKVSVRPIDEVIDDWSTRDPKPELEGKIVSTLIVAPDSAIVVFDFAGIYLDTFQLTRMSDGWRIVNKFYVAQ